MDVAFLLGSVKVFSSLVPVLLDRNLRIQVWEQEPGSITRWRLRQAASPGNVEALMEDISPGSTKCIEALIRVSTATSTPTWIRNVTIMDIVPRPLPFTHVKSNLP